MFWEGLLAYVVCGVISLLLHGFYRTSTEPLVVLSNFLTSGGKINHYAIAQMLFWIPIKEELLFRAILFLLINDK